MNMGMSNVNVLMSTGVSRLLGVGPGAIIALLAISSTSMPGRHAYRKWTLPTDGKNKVSLVEKNTATLVSWPLELGACAR